MTETTVTVDRLVMHLTGWRREVSAEPGVDAVEVDLTVENPPGSPGTGSAMYVPDMEVRDDEGEAYEVLQDDRLAGPLEPDTERTGRPQFRVPSQANELTLVFAPGTGYEVTVGLA